MLLALALPMLAHAGAWVQPKGKGLFITQATYYTTSSYYDADGVKQPQPRFTKHELQPYAEYGVSDAFTLGGSLYLDHVAQSHDKNQGIADPQIFLRARLYEDAQQVVSLEPLLKLPSHFQSDSGPQGGSRSRDLELSLRYGRNQPLLTARDYVDVRLGYRDRTRGLKSQLLMDAAVGIKANDAWEFTPALRGTMATAATDAASYSENGEQDYSLLKAELGVIRHLNDDEWLQATLFDHVAGIQTGDGFGVSLGYAQRF